MYEKKITVCIISIVFIFVSCSSTKVLSDDGNRITEYREFQSEIRSGETELAVSGERIKNDSENIGETGREIEQSNRELGNKLTELEQSIAESKGSESELGEILQRIREREITEDKLIELGIIRKD